MLVPDVNVPLLVKPPCKVTALLPELFHVPVIVTAPPMVGVPPVIVNVPPTASAPLVVRLLPSLSVPPALMVTDVMLVATLPVTV